MILSQAVEQYILHKRSLGMGFRSEAVRLRAFSDSLGKLFAAYLRRAEESVLGSVLVETTILYMSTRQNPAQVLQEAASAYKVDTAAIFLKVKQEFAAKAKTHAAKKSIAKVQPKDVKKAKAA